MGYKKFLGPGSSELVTGNSREKLSTFSPDFPVKESWEFPRIPRKDSWEFPRIFRKIVTWDSYNCSFKKDRFSLIYYFFPKNDRYSLKKLLLKRTIVFRFMEFQNEWFVFKNDSFF